MNAQIKNTTENNLNKSKITDSPRDMFLSFCPPKRKNTKGIYSVWGRNTEYIP
jgi:hypothetical protein